MTKRAAVTGTRLLSRGWADLREYCVEVQRGDGELQSLRREVYHRGDSAAVLVLCPPRRSAFLTRQLRVPMLVTGVSDGTVIEAPAGLLDGDEPAEAARREVLEETGLLLTSLVEVLKVFSNPSISTERVHLFVGEAEPPVVPLPRAGVATEGEDIEVVEISWPELVEQVERGDIRDAKTVTLVLAAAARGLLGGSGTR